MDLRKEAQSRFKETIRKAIAANPITAGARRDIERDYLASLPDIPFDPTRARGVLLADEIEHFAINYKLIDPFEPEKKKLRAAGYELSVGGVYAKAGEIIELPDKVGRDEILVQPFEVVIIQTLERLNMPDFMIARWNVAVGQAYQGFLWVGAAQVDPGFKGYLCCPIYNLSDKPRTLRRGQSLAVIDFVWTTAPTKRSSEFRFKSLERKRILFEDYDPKSLTSALTTHAQERLNRMEKEVAELRSTVFSSITVILTALGALVTALALFVSKQYPEALTRFSPPLLVSLAALIVAFAGVIVSVTRHSWVRYALFALVLIGIGFFLWWYSSTYPLSPYSGASGLLLDPGRNQ